MLYNARLQHERVWDPRLCRLQLLAVQRRMPDSWAAMSFAGLYAAISRAFQAAEHQQEGERLLRVALEWRYGKGLDPELAARLGAAMVRLCSPSTPADLEELRALHR